MNAANKQPIEYLLNKLRWLAAEERIALKNREFGLVNYYVGQLDVVKGILFDVYRVDWKRIESATEFGTALAND